MLDTLHVVRLGTHVVDEVRRRVQQDTLGHRGHKNDPLYKSAGCCATASSASPSASRPSSPLPGGRNPDREVDLAWQCYQQLRSIYHATAG